MDVPAALLTQLARLATSVGLDPEILHLPLTILVTDLRAAVPSFRGLQVIIVNSGQPITLTDLLPAGTDGAALASLRVPLSLIGPDHDGGSRVVFYAGTPGAFVDLAADLSYVLEATTSRDGETSRRLVLDADLPSNAVVSGLTGLAELSAVNRAVGILIDRGHTRDHAYAILQRAAAWAGVKTHVFAARMLGR